jgi:hypothetical protein
MKDDLRTFSRSYIPSLALGILVVRRLRGFTAKIFQTVENDREG